MMINWLKNLFKSKTYLEELEDNLLEENKRKITVIKNVRCGTQSGSNQDCCAAVGGWGEHYPNPDCRCSYHKGIP